MNTPNSIISYYMEPRASIKSCPGERRCQAFWTVIGFIEWAAPMCRPFYGTSRGARKWLEDQVDRLASPYLFAPACLSQVELYLECDPGFDRPAATDGSFEPHLVCRPNRFFI